MDNLWQQLKNEKFMTRHYYGDVVRFLFIAAAIIMLITLPFINQRLPVPLAFSLIAILMFGLIAGLTSPLQKNTLIINTGVSLVSLVVFEYYAVNSYLKYSALDALFIVNQLLAIIFFFALYYSTKTLRSKLFEEKNNKD